MNLEQQYQNAIDQTNKFAALHKKQNDLMSRMSKKVDKDPSKFRNREFERLDNLTYRTRQKYWKFWGLFHDLEFQLKGMTSY